MEFLTVLWRTPCTLKRRERKLQLMQTAGDRRAHVRYQVYGGLWGTLETNDAVCLHNLTPQGALFEAHQPLPIESVQSIALTLEGQPATADVRVRHLHPARSADGDVYLVGVEFLTTSVAFCEAVDQIVAGRDLHA